MENLITIILTDIKGEKTEISVQESNTIKYIIDELRKKKNFEVNNKIELQKGQKKLSENVSVKDAGLKNKDVINYIVRFGQGNEENKDDAQEILLILTNIGGEETEYTAKNTDTIRSLALGFGKQKNFPLTKEIIFYLEGDQKKRLDTKKTLKDYQIENETTLYYLLSEEKKKKEVIKLGEDSYDNPFLFIAIVHHEGDLFDQNIYTYSSFPIKNVIDQYKQNLKLTPDTEISVFFRDVKLDQQKSFDDYYMESNDIIELRY